MVMPLLLLYEFLIIQTGSSVRNGADVLLKVLMGFAGVHGLMGFTVLIFLGFSWVVYRDTAAGGEHLKRRYFIFMFAESMLYAFILGPLVAGLTNRLLYAKLALPGGVALKEQLIVSLGAGIYEELVFRFLLITALVWLFHKAMKLPQWVSAAFAIFWASFFFSAFHYVGVYAYDFQFSTFIFRLLAGVVLSLLFYFRGFGIVVYSHTVYDILISLQII
jgi:membrane protease YdiL (CAAX protease family)